MEYLEIPYCVTIIDNCFSNPKLNELVLHDNIAQIMNFSGNNALTELIVPIGATNVSVRDLACLKKLIIPATVTDYRVINLPALEELTVPYITTKQLEDYAITNLIDLVYNDSSVGGVYISDSTGNEKYAPTNFKTLNIVGSGYIGCANCLNGYSTIEEINVPNAISIVDNMFAGIQNLKKVIFSDNLLTLGASVFYNCSELVDVNLGTKVTTIGANTFENCNKLLRINSSEDKVILPSTLTTLSTGMFKNCSSIKSIDYTVNNNTVIPSYFAYGCTSLTNFEFKNGIVEISDCAFEGAGLTEVSGEEQLTFIGNRSLASTKLESVNLDGLSSSGLMMGGAFRDCTELSTISINSNVTKIGISTFEGCSSLSDLTPFENVDEIGSNAFRGIGVESLTLWANLTSVGSGAFNSCVNLKSVELSKMISVTQIPYALFGYCSQLEEIFIPAHITNISAFAFQFSGIKSISFDDDCEANLEEKSICRYVFIRKCCV